MRTVCPSPSQEQYMPDVQYLSTFLRVFEHC